MFAVKWNLIHQGCRQKALVLPAALSVPTKSHMPR